ncbi:MAG: helix-turn-helix transcriptional regulator, partial [Elusimicrobia bacterium]|nr:helix-turn-helix transcriptional regulator [Elusimicrobiota bacterium]
MEPDPRPIPTPAPAPKPRALSTDEPAAAAAPPGPAPASALAAEVGATLAAARLGRGYSLESVSQHTRIPRKFLEALEAGRFDDLPAPVYLRSFLADYCEYLELDFRPLWDKLHPAPAPAAAAAASPAQAPAEATPAAPDLPASPCRDALVSALGGVGLSVALAAALIWWVARGRAAGGPA